MCSSRRWLDGPGPPSAADQPGTSLVRIHLCSHTLSQLRSSPKNSHDLPAIVSAAYPPGLKAPVTMIVHRAMLDLRGALAERVIFVAKKWQPDDFCTGLLACSFQRYRYQWRNAFCPKSQGPILLGSTTETERIMLSQLTTAAIGGPNKGVHVRTWRRF